MLSCLKISFFVNLAFRYFLYNILHLAFKYVFCFSSTKASLLAALIFVIDKKSDMISAPHALVYFGVVIFFVYFKLSSLLLGITDPFLPFENLFCAVCMGGVFDVIQETFYGKPKTSEENGEVAKPKSGETIYKICLQSSFKYTSTFLTE